MVTFSLARFRLSTSRTRLLRKASRLAALATFLKRRILSYLASRYSTDGTFGSCPPARASLFLLPIGPPQEIYPKHYTQNGDQLATKIYGTNNQQERRDVDMQRRT
jgi:hypothetical protein